MYLFHPLCDKVYKLTILILLIYTSNALAVSDDIKKVDFKNFNFPGFKCLFLDKHWINSGCTQSKLEGAKELKAFKFKDGIYDVFPEKKKLLSQLKLEKVHYGDFNNDNVLDALVEISYFTVTASGNHDYIAYIFTIKDSEVKFMDQFANIPDFSLMKEIESQLKGINHVRFYLKVKNNKIYVSDGFGNKGRCCPEYLITFIGEFKESKFKWRFIAEPYYVPWEGH